MFPVITCTFMTLMCVFDCFIGPASINPVSNIAFWKYTRVSQFHITFLLRHYLYIYCSFEFLPKEHIKIDPVT